MIDYLIDTLTSWTRTDGQTTCLSSTALCLASHSKKTAYWSRCLWKGTEPYWQRRNLDF